jgi:hypothetical protein
MIVAFLYTKDIALINGVCSKTARQYIHDINALYQLPNHKFVSLKAYCDYFMADERHVLTKLEASYSKGE